MTSTFTTNINLEQPGLGDYANDWNAPVNADWALIDQNFGSSTTVAFTGSNITLTVAQSAYFQIVCTGTLTGNVELILPATIGGRRVIFNQCTGAFTLTVLNGSTDTGGGVVVGQGYQTPVVLTAGQAYYDAYGATPPGTLLPFAGVTTPPGFLLCFGQAISRTSFAQLFAALGTTWGTGDGSTTFNLPDFRGRGLAGADNMGGTPAGRLTGYTVGTSGGNQSSTLVSGNVPQLTFTPSGSVSAPTITQTGAPLGGSAAQGINAVGGGAFSLVNGAANISAVASAPVFTGNAITIGNASPSAFSVTQPTAAINYMIRY